MEKHGKADTQQFSIVECLISDLIVECLISDLIVECLISDRFLIIF